MTWEHIRHWQEFINGEIGKNIHELFCVVEQGIRIIAPSNSIFP